MIRTGSEKRQYRRFEVDAEISIGAFPELNSAQGAEQALQARILDISEGGLCLLTKIPLKVSSPVRCNIPLSFTEVPISVPSLLQVRWTYKGPESHEYRSGLQFLL
jgi:c-di-GMP-binding flagellar brake protein YcgR